MKPRTETTHLTTESLVTELAQIARNSCALDREEFMGDMVAVAVAVRNARNRFIKALAITYLRYA
ncbi:MAG: hypothetical protein GY767_12930 [Shimia sp.]|nr:hypothetical protein [Shimia sp.]MCP4826114.1 hypothetical protein [Shimia sp.]